MLEIIFWQAFLLFVWFQSSFLDSLSRLPILKSILDREDYDKFAQTFDSAHYTLYLSQTKYGKVFGCDVCMNFWMTMVTSYFLGYTLFPVTFILSFLVYNLLRKTYANSQS